MKDPFEVLGVSPSASDEEIKKAYRDLVRKYHPDNYVDNPLADLAQEKMKEINEAYEAVTRQRSGGGNTYSSSTERDYGASYNSTYAKIRQLLNQNRVDEAETLLNGIGVKDAEWYYLNGVIAFKRGWMDEAKQNFRIACQINPANMEYRQAYNRVGGNYSYGGQQDRSADGDICGADICDLCSALMCMNCLCGGCR